MLLYCDASALVKVYLTEDHTEAVRRRIVAADVVATHAVAYVEARSALARRRSAGDLPAPAHDEALALIDADWSRWAVVPMDERRAGQLAARHGLRALDAVHLAAALALREAGPEATLSFCTFDERQLAAAQAEGLLALGPDEGVAGAAPPAP